MNQNTIQKIVELKASGHKSIYFLEVRGLEVIFRPLTFDEYTTVKGLEGYLDGAAVNDAIVMMCALYCSEGPVDSYVANCKNAFDIDHIAQFILDVSGFENQETFLGILREKRVLAHQLQSLIEIYICSAFKAISPLDLKHMNLEELIELLAKAEEAMNKPIDFDAIFGVLTEKEMKLRQMPTPQGMNSTEDILSPQAASKPKFR